MTTLNPPCAVKILLCRTLSDDIADAVR